MGRFKLRLNIPGLGCMAGYCSAPQSLGRMDPNSGKIHGPCERQRLGPQLRNLSTNSAKFNDLSLYLKALLKIQIGFKNTFNLYKKMLVRAFCRHFIAQQDFYFPS